MNKGVILAIIVIVGAGIYIVSQQNRADQTNYQQSLSLDGKISSDQQGKLTSAANDQMAKAKAEAEAQLKEAQSQLEAQKSAAMAKMEEKQSRLRELLAKAKELIQNGKYDEAMVMAQNALKIDSGSSEAQGIIDLAKSKIKEAAQAKLDTVKGDLAGKVPSFGQ